MPFMKIVTNLKKDAIPSDFCEKATTLLAEQLGKSASYVQIHVNPDQIMTLGSSSEPCANITLMCLGVLGPEKNKTIAPVLFKFIEESLGIKQDRFYVNFQCPERHEVAWNGQTFG